MKNAVHTSPYRVRLRVTPWSSPHLRLSTGLRSIIQDSQARHNCTELCRGSLALLSHNYATFLSTLTADHTILNTDIWCDMVVATYNKGDIDSFPVGL